MLKQASIDFNIAEIAGGPIVTDFFNGVPLKAVRIGKCLILFRYSLEDGVRGFANHFIRGTTPHQMLQAFRDYGAFRGGKVAIVASLRAHPFTKIMAEGLAELLEVQDYDVVLRGFDDAALRDATLHPSGTLEVYRHDTCQTQLFGLG